MSPKRVPEPAIVSPRTSDSQPRIDENFISADAGNGEAACYRPVGGKTKQPAAALDLP